MPPPSYEYAWGMPFAEGSSYITPFPIFPEGMLVLRANPGSEFAIQLGPVALKVNCRKDEIYVVRFAEERIRVQSKYLFLTVRSWNGKTWFAANGTLLGSDSSTFDNHAANIIVNRGTCHLISAQYLGGSGQFLQFNGGVGSDESLVEFKDERNPFRFDWGLRSCAILNVFIALAIARDMVLGSRDCDVDTDRADVLSRISSSLERLGALRYLFDALLKWPHWRPCAGQYPESGIWDRNSFTNGTLPALFALLARIFDCAERDDVIQRFHDRGTSFLNASIRGPSLAFPERGEEHWLKRSANHGLIMLMAYMVGAKLLGQTNHKDAQAVDLVLGKVLHRLHEDGSFCEGVAYEFFGLSYLLPYIQLFGPDHRYNETYSVQSLQKLLGLTYEWISLSHDADGSVFANFGDNFTSQVRRTSHFAFVQRFAERRLDAPPAYGEQVDEFFSLAPPLDVSPSSSGGLETRFYPKNQTSLVASFGTDGRREAGLFVIGSTLQRTHNHNHDCGGFAFYWGKDGVMIPRSRRESHLNNAVGLLKGGEVLQHRSARNYSGAVRRLSVSPDEVRIMSLVEPTATFADGKPLSRLERIFHFRRGS
nr:hypothetical protein [Hyphomicrobium sp.]